MIKLCGIRREEDVSYINEVLPDFMGMILSSGFKRSITPDKAYEITRSLDSRIKKVGVFVNENEDFILNTAEKISLDIIQLHGNENASLVESLKGKGFNIWKAVRVEAAEDILKADKLNADMLLLDSFQKGKLGGTGIKFNSEEIIKSGYDKPFFLAGGINEENLKEALTLSPNVDISSGTETDGVKDLNKIRKIMKIYKGEM